MLLTLSEPYELLLPLLQPPLPSSSSLARPTAAKGMTVTYATSLAPRPPSLGDLGDTDCGDTVAHGPSGLSFPFLWRWLSGKAEEAGEGKLGQEGRAAH